MTIPGDRGTTLADRTGRLYRLVMNDEPDYATLTRLAIYLEIGWSDYLLAAREARGHVDSLPYPNPLANEVLPDFPRLVSEHAWKWANSVGLKPERYCDLGGATGRAVYEVDKLFPRLDSLTLVEPSTTFCEWASILLGSDDALPDFPVIGRAGSPEWIAPVRRPNALARAKERLRIENKTLEGHDPEQGYDLMTCLNVIDRHPNPAKVIDNIERCMNDGGLLVLSCPFDFHDESTPDRTKQIDNLDVLFSDRPYWSHVGETELYYEYRSHRRSWTRLVAQVVAKRWTASSPDGARS